MKHSKTPWAYTIRPSTLRVFIHEDGDPAGPSPTPRPAQS
jgi:hypothetical protein